MKSNNDGGTVWDGDKATEIIRALLARCYGDLVMRKAAMSEADLKTVKDSNRKAKEIFAVIVSDAIGSIGQDQLALIAKDMLLRLFKSALEGFQEQERMKEVMNKVGPIIEAAESPEELMKNLGKLAKEMGGKFMMETSVEAKGTEPERTDKEKDDDEGEPPKNRMQSFGM